ncbi:MAG TPA: STAS domain-containing protein [Devosiaceae bacterium]|nr:STAS domain-containing protein [Devosiaceae bacterium]
MASGAEHNIELSGALGLRDVAGLAASLKTALEAHQAVTLAAEGLTEVDVSILQVLVAAHKSATKTGKSLQFKATTAGTLRQTLVKAGFLTAGGEPLTPEGNFWVGPAGSSKGMAA